MFQTFGRFLDLTSSATECIATAGLLCNLIRRIYPEILFIALKPQFIMAR
jgi:hypothetical protein